MLLEETLDSAEEALADRFPRQGSINRQGQLRSVISKVSIRAIRSKTSITWRSADLICAKQSPLEMHHSRLSPCNLNNEFCNTALVSSVEQSFS